MGIERKLESLLQSEGLDLTPAHANVMMVLFETRRPMTARQLAENLQLSQVTVGRFVQALEKKGWLSRVRDVDDRRNLILTPTDKAREAFSRCVRVSNALLDDAFGCFDKGEMESMVRVTRKIRDNLVDS
jgi:DNA-binding MarR family transcriptional regulator